MKVGSAETTEVFTGNVIDDIEDAESAATGELVAHKIQRPTGIGADLNKDRSAATRRLTPGFALSHRQPFFAIKPIDAIDTRGFSLPA